MAVYLPKYRDYRTGETNVSWVYWMEFTIRGRTVRESTGTRFITLAKKVQDKRLREIERSDAGFRKRTLPNFFTKAAEDYIQFKSATLRPGSLKIEQANLVHLKPVFGKLLISDIDEEDVASSQKMRQAEGAANSTINLEVATVRAILRRNGFWSHMQGKVKMLPARIDVGKALTREEEQALLKACCESRSRCLLPFVTVALQTGARLNVVRTLQWKDIDFARRCLKFGQDKTVAGTGRIVPLNSVAMTTLDEWSRLFPNRLQDHYVFPIERYGGAGTIAEFGFSGARHTISNRSNR